MPCDPRITDRRIRHAAGYLALGMVQAATEELALIPSEQSSRPEVVSARIDLHMAKKEWEQVVTLGVDLARRFPKRESGWISWAFALRELNRIEEAKAVLLEAEPAHGRTCGVLHYNLACYHCLLGDRAEARRRLTIARRMDDEWKRTALGDPDLRAMHAEIAAMD